MGLQERNHKGKEFVAMANRRDRSPGEHRDTGCEDVILDSIAEGVFTVDSDWRITSFNRAAEKITGTARNEAIGRQCWNVFRAAMFLRSARWVSPFK